MVNAQRYAKSIDQYLTPAFYKMMRMLQKGRPPGTEIPKAAMIPPRDRLPDSEIPFASGDRVQIVRGEDKGKVCHILMRYPGFGNAFLVAGAGFENEMINVIEAKQAEEKQENWEPVTKIYKTFDYKDFRLVSKVRGENGDEDVAIHSLKLGPPEYDAVSNTYKRIRYAAHDPSVTIPWPVQKAEAIESDLTTNAVAADTRTHFVTSFIEPALPLGAVDQITNPHNRFKRGRYARRITQADLDRLQPPVMPLSAKTRATLEQIAAMPKPHRRAFDDEIEQYVAEQVRQGLERRREEEHL